MTRRLLLLLAITLALVSCDDKQDDRALITARVAEIADLAERHDISGMMELTTRDYVANPGGRDSQDVRGVLLIALRRYGTFQIRHPEPSIDLDDSKKRASVTVPFLVVREGEDFPDADLDQVTDDPEAWAKEVGEAVGDPYYLELSVRKVDGDWLVYKSTIRGTKSVGGI